jgi:energy-coupling factor transporter ATP-binding protein EcfA2
MQKISKLILKNFKFFYGEVSINFNRKHVLLYGENGSGKSSIYWALYTFLQSVFKTDNLEIRKYFDPRHDESLINRYASGTAESAIVLELEDEHKASSRREISLSTINTKSDNLIKETILGSDFIDHKVLSRIYAYYHKEDIDLFDFFNHHLLAFINFREELSKPEETTGSKNAETWWKYFDAGLIQQPKMHEQVYKEFQAFIVKFNVEFKYYLEQIEQLTNDYLITRFGEKFKIKFDYVNGTYNDFKEGSKGRSWKVKPPQILLSVYLITNLIADENKKKVTSPQSFLNEAKLSALALAMRMAILDEKFVAAYPKVLVLDDMLMSMDMSNREFVLGMILENYLSDYQILFFTHQRGLFEDARKFIEVFHAELARKNGETNSDRIKNAWKENWLLYEMYETENDLGIPSPKIQPYESSLQKALKYFREPIDYNSCGNNLRIALEEFFRTFIPYKYFVNDKGEQLQATSLTLDPLLVKAREYFNYVGFNTTPLDKLDRYRVRSLNPSSHYNPKTDYFKKELLEIFSILDSLKKNRNQSALAKDNKIKFEVKTQSGKSFAYTAILLDNIYLYQKSDGSPSFYKDTDERAYAMIGFTEDNTTTTILTHEINRCTLQTLYTDTVGYINRSQVAIIETDMYKVFTDENGKTLEQLKKILMHV